VWNGEKPLNVDVCVGGTAVEKINAGDVTESHINDDLNKAQPAAGFTVIVTVITEAAANTDGSAHFQTFVDVYGNGTPTEDDKKSICHGLATSLETHLGVPAGTVACTLTLKPTAKRQTTTSYIADMNVGGQSNSLQTAAPAVILSFSAMGAALVSLLF